MSKPEREPTDTNNCNSRKKPGKQVSCGASSRSSSGAASRPRDGLGREADLFDSLDNDCASNARKTVDDAEGRDASNSEEGCSSENAVPSSTEVANPTLESSSKLGDATYLKVDDVAARYRVGKATIWRWRRSRPGFPDRVKLSNGVSRWSLKSLEAFEAKLEDNSQ